MSARRILPSNSNFEQLKNQARDLLRAYERGDAEAVDRVRAVYTPKSDSLKLREAQQALAREYGFSSWQALRDELRAGESSQDEVLEQAINNNNVELVRELITGDPDLVDAPIGYSKAGALTWAAECRGSATPVTEERLEIARLLINAGADVNEHSGSPLMRASLNDNRTEMRDLLFAHGADVNAIWNNYGPLIFAPCETLAPQSIEWMIAHGADPNKKLEGAKYHSGALDMALCTYVHENRHASVEQLIQGGSHFEDRAEMDIHRGRLDSLNHRLDEDPDLVQGHSDFRSGKEYGGLYGGCPLRYPTLLHICAEYNELDAARILLEGGADVNARARSDEDGVGNETSVFHLVTSNFNKCYELLEFLISRGADLAVRASIRIPTRGGAAKHDNDVILRDVTPLGYVMNYPNDYQPGTGSGSKANIDTKPHDNIIELLKLHGALE